MAGFHDNGNRGSKMVWIACAIWRVNRSCATDESTSPQFERAYSNPLLLAWDIGNMNFAYEEGHMVFGRAEDIDIPDKHHLIMTIENSIVEDFFQRLVATVRNIASATLRCLQESSRSGSSPTPR